MSMGDIAIQEFVDVSVGGKFVVISAFEVTCDDVVRVARFFNILKHEEQG